MLKPDAIEAKPIVITTLNALLSWASTRGRAGSELRTIVGDTKAYVMGLLQSGIMIDALVKCFETAYLSGINFQQMETVRRTAAAQTALSVGAIMTRDVLIELALSIQGDILGNMTFVSREDVDQARNSINASFAEMEEEVADRMDSMTYRALVKLHAAIIVHLYETARPLPRMLGYQFNMPLPTLVFSHKLYADASRADELRAENKIVHPAFAPRFGRALSA